MTKTQMLLRAVFGVLTAAVSLAGCTGDDGAPPQNGQRAATTTTASTASLQRYCELARNLEEQRAEAMGNAKDDEEARRAVVELARSQLDDVAELQRTAPAEIARDVGTRVAATARVAQGDLTALEQSRFLSASERLRRYEERHCGIRGAEDGQHSP